MKNEPIKHHYIPQFILKNFCFDGSRHLWYCDKMTSETSVKETREVFMVRNLYRDEINNIDDPTRIEKDLARFEGEISNIIKYRFFGFEDILLTVEEDEKLKLFFAIMGFRSKRTDLSFGTDVTDDLKKFYSMYQDNGKLIDFWKRNLSILVNCRSLNEVLNHKDIDTSIKVFLRRDTIGYYGLYFIVLERRGPEDFIISDTYPTVITGSIESGVELHMYSIFPISPYRILLLASNGVERAPEKVAFFSKEVLKKPRSNLNGKSITIHVKKIYEQEVRYVNSVLMKEALEGFAFKNDNRVVLPTNTSSRNHGGQQAKV